MNIQTRYSKDCPSSEETTEDGNVVWSKICDKFSFLSWGLISEEALLLSPPTKYVTVSVLKVLKYFASRASGSTVAKRTSFEKWLSLVMVLAILIFLFLQSQDLWTFWQTSACALSIENDFFLVPDLTIRYLNILRTGSRGAQYLSSKLSELGSQSNTTLRICPQNTQLPHRQKFYLKAFERGGGSPTCLGQKTGVCRSIWGFLWCIFCPFWGLLEYYVGDYKPNYWGTAQRLQMAMQGQFWPISSKYCLG